VRGRNCCADYLPIVDSEHTQKALQLPDHPKIKVFRHPEHLLDGKILESAVLDDLKKIALKGLDIAKLPEEGLKKLYGLSNDAILYWAHHEKLLLVDGKVAFMGGLDLCFGRWDSHAHPIADSHPTDINASVFPGQDYNNARIYDFQHVDQYNKNKLDRTISSRMGWSDLSFSIQGPMVEDLRAHFVQRWNFIYNEKYVADKKYHALSLTPAQIPDGYYKLNGHIARAIKGTTAAHNWFHMPHRRGTIPRQAPVVNPDESRSGISIQLVRSCAEWSNGVLLEVSLQIVISSLGHTNHNSTLLQMHTYRSSMIANISSTLKTNSSSPRQQTVSTQSRTRLELPS
jgi:phospholipase D1/2